MKKHNIRDTPVIVIPKGYTIDDLMDFDDEGYENGEPVRCEEVKESFKNAKKNLLLCFPNRRKQRGRKKKNTFSKPT